MPDTKTIDLSKDFPNVWRELIMCLIEEVGIGAAPARSTTIDSISLDEVNRALSNLGYRMLTCTSTEDISLVEICDADLVEFILRYYKK